MTANGALHSGRARGERREQLGAGRGLNCKHFCKRTSSGTRWRLMTIPPRRVLERNLRELHIRSWAQERGLWIEPHIC